MTPRTQDSQRDVGSKRDDTTRDEEAALKRLEQVRPPPAPEHVASALKRAQRGSSKTSCAEWLRWQLYELQARLGAVWSDPPPQLASANLADLLKVRRILKATLVALIRGDNDGLARLSNAAVRVHEDSLSGSLTDSERQQRSRPQAAMVQREDGSQGVLRYGDVPDDDSFGWQIGGARIGEGRGAMARAFAEQVEMAYQFYDESEFADWLIGRPWNSNADIWWPAFSAMHLGALVVNQAAVARGDAGALFTTPRDKTLELREEFAPVRERLRQIVRRWQLDLECRDQEPESADFEALVRAGFKALGANELAVDNLFKAAKQKARRSRDDAPNTRERPTSATTPVPRGLAGKLR